MVQQLPRPAGASEARSSVSSDPPLHNPPKQFFSGILNFPNFFLNFTAHFITFQYSFHWTSMRKVMLPLTVVPWATAPGLLWHKMMNLRLECIRNVFEKKGAELENASAPRLRWNGCCWSFLQLCDQRQVSQGGSRRDHWWSSFHPAVDCFVVVVVIVILKDLQHWQVGIMTHMNNNMEKFCEAKGITPCRPPTTPIKPCVGGAETKCWLFFFTLATCWLVTSCLAL